MLKQKVKTLIAKATRFLDTIEPYIIDHEIARQADALTLNSNRLDEVVGKLIDPRSNHGYRLRNNAAKAKNVHMVAMALNPKGHSRIPQQQAILESRDKLITRTTQLLDMVEKHLV